MALPYRSNTWARRRKARESSPVLGARCGTRREYRTGQTWQPRRRARSASCRWDGVTVFSVASGLDLAAPGTGGVPVEIGKLVVILGRGVNDREPQAFTILGVNQDGLRDMRDVAEATTPRGQSGDISQKILLAEHLPQDAKQVLQLVVIDVAGQTTATL